MSNTPNYDKVNKLDSSEVDAYFANSENAEESKLVREKDRNIRRSSRSSRSK